MGKKKIIILVVSIVLLVILIIGALTWKKYIADGKKEEVVNRSGNESFNVTGTTYNFIKFDDWIVFSAGPQALGAGVLNFGEGIYKFNMQTGQVIKLDDYAGICFNIWGKNLYYISNVDSNIKRINLDTLETDWIPSIETNYILLNNDYIYYRDVNGDNIYRINNLEGENKRLVAEYTEGDIQILDGYIYYIDAQTHNLFKKSVENLQEEEVKLIDENVSQFYSIGDKIIYLVENNIKQFSVSDGSSDTLIKDDITSNFVVKDNKVYYYSSEDSSLCEIDVETKEKVDKVENLEEMYRLQLYDNYIFYHDTEGYPFVKLFLYYVDLETNKIEELPIETN